MSRGLPGRRADRRAWRPVAAALGLAALVAAASCVAAGEGRGAGPGGGTSPAAPAARVETPAPLAAGVGTIGVTVSDLGRAEAFYTGVLGFTAESRAEASGDGAERLYGVFGSRARSATLRLGAERLELIEFRTPAGRPVPAGSRSNDRWFQHIAIAVGDMGAALARLEAAGVRPASAGPQTLPAWNAAAGGISAFYFHDPDGHVLEIIHFPEGKGDPRWRAAAGEGGRGTFLGIDHTAIVVADTERSLAFYRGVLGMRVAGGSRNHGLEQERLNNVFGARLRITTLRAGAGPGVELLEYVSPADGLDYPADSRPTDLWHWHVTVETDLDAERAEARLLEARARPVSAAPAGERREGPAVMFRDPDGHAVLVRSRAGGAGAGGRAGAGREVERGEVH